MQYFLLNINNRKIKYTLKRSKKAKYMRMQISVAGGLEIILPFYASMADAEQFIFRKKDWIEKHYNRVETREKFLYLGRKIELVQVENLTKNIYEGYLYSESKIYLKASGLDESMLVEIYEKWLYKKAVKYLKQRLDELAKLYGFNYSKSSIRRQKSRWGSCSSRKTISLNFRLMMFDKRVIDYVIVHELCHLKEMNHSAKFWRLVESILPDYKEYRRILKY